MFELPPDDRLSAWAEHRRLLDISEDPIQDLIDFWIKAPYIPFNRNVDPYNQRSWPTPWDIIIQNKYDDFTKVLMMAWTLKLTDKFKDSQIEIKTYTDAVKNREYNIAVIDQNQMINYYDNSVASVDELPESFSLENLIEVQRPR
jgi:hypothetical protein